jgi:Ribose/Galactose Isomerase
LRVGVATDHGVFELKEELAAHLRPAGHEVVDFGTLSLDPDDDCPDFVIPLARAVAASAVERGVGRLRQWRRRVGVCEQNPGSSRRAGERSLFCAATG